MNRRDTLKALALGTISSGLVLQSCRDNGIVEQQQGELTAEDFSYDRQPEELEKHNELNSYTFFTDHEMATITVLGDIIIPADDVSGNASEAKVPEFIEFIVKDMPQHQVPMRGGLRWLDMQCLKRYEQPFKDCNQQQQIEMVDAIAYPNRATPEMKQGVAFFTLMRNLTATGFYTSQMGVQDLGYVGNAPNQWNGVPPEVLKQYKLAYTDKELKETVSFGGA
ncbi:gluconate 2-dehydrogenase subunit 3 family protein [soil metagenome]